MSLVNLEQIVEENIKHYDKNLLNFALLILGKMYNLSKENQLSSECHFILYNKNNIQIMINLLSDMLNSGISANDAIISLFNSINLDNRSDRVEDKNEQKEEMDEREEREEMERIEKREKGEKGENSIKLLMIEERVKQVSTRNCLEIHNHLIHVEKTIENMEDELSEKLEIIRRTMEDTKMSINDTILKTISMLVPKIINDSLKSFFR